MAKEYIEREAAMTEIEEWHDMYPDSDAAREALSLVKRAIRKLPAADVRPVVRGKWIRGDSWSEGCGMGESYGFYYECSVCKDVVQGDYKDCGMKYCPNCGADMRQEPT